MTPRRASVVAAALLLASACADGSRLTDPAPVTVVSLVVASGDGQDVWSARRSPEPFRVRALDAGGEPVRDATVEFRVEGAARGILSQPSAVTDDGGYAETYVMEARPGDGELVATAGEAGARFSFTVNRAPGQIVFESSTGAPGLPGFPHPDTQ